MNLPEKILAAREEKERIILSYIADGDVITIKANLPGMQKNIGEAFLIVRYFTARVLEISGGKVRFFSSDDGPFAIITGGNLKKEAACALEETEIGRFADIDVYLKGSSHSVTRGTMRKCFICSKPAFICQREKSHSKESLINVLKSSTRNYIDGLLSRVLKESLMAELNLENKFGLVTPTSKGSHDDMDYSLMTVSQDAIIPWLCKMFWSGFDTDNVNDVLPPLREMGKACEADMYRLNGGINAYKGFIFIAGVIMGAAGYLLSGKEGFNVDIFSVIRTMCKDITSELNTESSETNGIKAYKTYGIMGVRKNAQEGFPAIPEAIDIIDGEYSEESLRKALCYIVSKTDDTVLLKRCKNIESYRYFKEKISKAYILDCAGLKKLNKECINAHISIGGSADILAASVLVKKLSGIVSI